MPQTPNVGELGEQLVAQWLQTQNWQILHHRWRCRWGEIDLIACNKEQKQESQGESKSFLKIPQTSHLASSPLLAFVEVKTRSRENWDDGGRLAITPPKQAKLWQTAELFLAKRPDLASLPCRFDVAIVSCQCLSLDLGGDRLDSPTSALSTTRQVPSVQLGQPVVLAGYQLTLQEYIQSAFD